LSSTRRGGNSAPTIVDVANRAGVSIKTVSRVLNNEANVHSETRQAVLEAAGALKYRPKLSARSLAGARSFLVGLLYYAPSAAFVSAIQQGATARCREAGVHLVVESLDTAPGRLEQQVEHMVSTLRVDGMIVTPPLCDNGKVLRVLRRNETRCVLISPDVRRHGLPIVRMDDRRAAAEVVQALVELGHRRIAFVQGDPAQAAALERRAGFEQAMRDAGLSIEAALMRVGDFTFASGLEQGHALLALRKQPSAVFASNDDMALGVMAAARARNVPVPQALSVVGFDDSPAATLVSPALSSVRQPLFEMATAAVDLALAPSQAGAPTEFVLPHRLMLRESSAPLAAGKR
jgi:LacI family transcriptional regulator